jgi:preprotein translocase subunit SecD
VGPGLGADSIAAGQLASIVGVLLVSLAMIVLYGVFGVFSVIALYINLVLIVGFLSLFQATLTLPGIAGIVLTMGVAVDANVLIFERMREEVRDGRTPIAALDRGFGQAMSAIIDANLTTMISTALLYIVGTGPVRGFAVTLFFGTLTSMFTAVTVTRLMVFYWMRRRGFRAVPI